MEQSSVRAVLERSGCFTPEWYLERYPEVAMLGVDPLDDYLNGGFESGRNPNQFFDGDFYREQNPDFPIEMNPLLHYCTEGWKIYRNPSPHFNTWWYKVRYMERADDGLNPLAHYLLHGQEAGFLPILGKKQKLGVKEKTQFNTRSIELFQSLPLTATLASSISAATEAIQQYDLADMFAGKACELEPLNVAWHMQLARILLNRSGWSRLLSLMDTVIRLDENNAEGFFLRGLANEKLERYGAAAETYRFALSLEPEADVEWFYRLGCCEEILGNQELADIAYGEVERRSEGLPEELGVGVLHERAGAWDRAAKFYKKRLEHGGASASLYYRYGRMLDFCYYWEQAEDAYRQSLNIDANNSECLYHLGQVLERLERYAESASFYQAACSKSQAVHPDWRYRQGYVAWRSGLLREACEAWLLALPALLEKDVLEDCPRSDLEECLKQSRQDANIHLRLGLAYEKDGMLRQAADAFAEAVARRHDYSPEDYYHLGRIHVALGEWQEACVALKEIRQIKGPFDLPVNAEEDIIKQTYSEYLDTLPVRSDVVLYESFHGASVSCNPYAIFNYLLEHKNYSDLVHVWALKSLDSIPKRYRAMRNVIFVRHGSSLYLRYLATARYLINNNTFFPYFLRREGQKYLNTWHGTPLKALGVNIPGAIFDHKNVVRNILQCTHLIYPNQHTCDVFLQSYQARDLYNGKLARTGYPRIDLMLNADAARRQKLRSDLGIDNGLPTILYAPTWRGSTTPEMDVERLVADLELLGKYKINLVVSAHHLMYQELRGRNLAVTLLGQDFDTTEFLSVVDVLITDYSSIMFDYLPLRKPIVIYAYDLNVYSAERGLCLDIHAIPASLCTSRNELAEKLDGILNGTTISLDVSDACAEFCPMEDGQSSARVVEFFFEDISENEPFDKRSDRRKILFYAGNLVPNGVTAAFLRLAALLPEKEYSISLAVDPWVIESYPQRMQRLSEIPAHINVLGRISFPVGSREESWLNIWVQRQKGDVSPRVRELLSGFYQREYRRLYGCAEFNVVVDFCGYTFHWAALFALGRPMPAGAAMWLHNDMHAETKNRFPFLKTILSFAGGFDRLVSVSADVHAVNRHTLVSDYAVGPDRLCYVHNCIDPAWLREKAAEPLDSELNDWAHGCVLIGSIGRLSREKAQDRIIKAFSQLHQCYPNARLVIAGQGPEKDRLSELISLLGLDDSVRLLGYIENPYPLFKRLDLFVLPSDYEGQGIVLLEALALGRPVIATDIPGPREILQEQGGLLVEPSQEGVRAGIEQFFQGRLPVVNFKADAYMESSRQAFAAVVSEIS
ncbi:glycosyltransferase [Ectopseudomonas mendocina]|nr:CDP-glycerol glycerophosphotransferase family protein [Pseudomonas mendocina]TRO13758.1 glycosyltransferase [Pseudomonas mendocina]TRO21687.1 glycosyltransferase [Pseudomonas mendocina]